MSATDELQRRIDALRSTTADVRTTAGLLLLAPGSALAAAGGGILAPLTGTAHLLGSWAVILAAATIIPIGAAIRPRRPRARRQTRFEILAAAQDRADGTADGFMAEEIQRLQEILDDKWAWVRVAILFGALALTSAAAALVIATN